MHVRFFLLFLSFPLKFVVAVAVTGAPPITTPATIVILILCCVCIDTGACCMVVAIVGIAQSLDSIVGSVVGMDTVVREGVGSCVGACASFSGLLRAVEAFMARRTLSPFCAFSTASHTL